MHNKRLPCALAGAIALFTMTGTATATEPCGDFGECKVLVEINSSDGDIGFHFLMDGDDLVRGRLNNPDGQPLFKTQAARELREQLFTETFVESAEPLCFDPATDDDPSNDDEDFLTLEEFVDRFDEGIYRFVGRGPDGRLLGETGLGFDLPAAPAEVNYDEDTGMISWAAGHDLGMCGDSESLASLVDDGALPLHPENVPVAAWEIVFVPDFENGDPLGALEFSVRVAGDIGVKSVTVPAEYLDSLPPNTPAKMEIGAIGAGDNATFTEIDGLCVNEEGAGCPD